MERRDVQVGPTTIDNSANPLSVMRAPIVRKAGGICTGIAKSKPGVGGRLREKLVAKLRVERGVSTQEPQCSSVGGSCPLPEGWKPGSDIAVEE